jgi:hypothetical protein
MRRRHSFGLVEKLFQKQTAIVQATSDGDIDRVARLGMTLVTALVSSG